MLHCRVKGEGAILGNKSHVYCIERGGMSAVGSIHPIAIENKPDGTIDLDEIEYNIPPNSVHLS